MGEEFNNGVHEQLLTREYDKIDSSLASVADKLCMMEHLADFENELGALQTDFLQVEQTARQIDNFRLASLSRAVHLLLVQLLRTPSKAIRPDTYAFLIYSVKTIIKLAGVSRYAAQTGLDAQDASFSEAIGAIIDHTDELTQPHMQC